jgi:colicin import membrane protein
MSEKVVVPKFEIPSETMHPAIKAVAAIGVLLLGTTAILGIAIMHRRSAQEAAVAKRDAIIATRAAEAKAADEKAKAEAAAKVLAAKEAARKAEEAKIAKAEEAKAAKAAAAKAAADEKLAEADGHHHHHHGKASAKGSKASAGAAVASKGSDDKKSGPKSTRDNAAIDKLLASFK